MTEKITIPLTGRRPVVVDGSEWPLIASVKEDSFTGHDYARHRQALQNFELDIYIIRVRQHADGRTIVYAVYADNTHKGHGSWEGGELLPPGADIPAAIERVGREAGMPAYVIQQCIADLPPEEI